MRFAAAAAAAAAALVATAARSGNGPDSEAAGASGLTPYADGGQFPLSEQQQRRPLGYEQERGPEFVREEEEGEQVGGGGRGEGPRRETRRRRPNIVVVLTDDQDAALGSLEHMPRARRHLIERGTLFSRHYATTAVCCPSRVSLWTGRLAHNTNVTDVSPPYGGYPKFISQGFNDNYLPVWLQEAGYNTYYTGKLFNAHTVDNWNSPHPRGFTSSDFLLDPHTYDYLNSTFQRDDEPPRSYEGQYSTDVLADKAYNLLEAGIRGVESDGKPFFLVAAPIAPHANVKMGINSGAPGAAADLGSVLFTEPVPAERHKHLFPDARVPRTANFNPEEPSGANWVLALPRQNETNVEYNDHFYRQRLRSLQAVDELVEGLVTRLADGGVLDDTYIFYTSDNGYHIGQHRLQPGKTCGYEEDVNVPLLVRGPGVAANYSTAAAVADGNGDDRGEGLVTTHVDLVPTFFELLGLPPRDDFDGAAIPVTRAAIEEAKKAEERREHAGIEYWGFAMGEGIYNREHQCLFANRLTTAAAFWLSPLSPYL
ncbi:alkaline-phosphatase-like protein [Durotheca rogersii]|uniref:alkaline-phosphatase-like protein n=1 Tax=Durotheca rogersii TaxID=419775 RepID=UPI00221F67B2|nr:alkaline-phosphatase-like protein [Durotheca rogersii]KAI5859467.1 alkaline-phosphatase-like protein [Durotheca rogersii]